MTDDSSPAAAPRDLAFSPVSPALPVAAAADAAEAGRSRAGRGLSLAVLVLALLAIVAIVFAWRADQRVRGSERELVKRQQDSAVQVTEATLLARQAQEGARDAAAKVALLEARLNEVAVQRGQLEALVQSVARSRDENLVADSEATLRAGLQQGALTGSAEPMVAALKQIDERFARANQPRLEPVRRAIARDLDRIKAASVADVATLSIRLDEAVRLVDELPLLSAAEPRRDLARGTAAAAAPASAAASAGFGNWLSREFGQAGRLVVDSAWSELRSLVRITRIDQPEAMLVAPDQAFFLKENLKLRLLNARLSLLARQFDAARGDLRWARGAIERYFDRSSRRTQIALDLVTQVEQQSRQSASLRPDDTFAALAAVAR
ncbi:MAG TPA: uroporphyrinogen-III C-methyltransferase [Caldimonas sp.]|nr:uroporphyrinogen-III C-methyltransferase [Caldimonas sp.]